MSHSPLSPKQTLANAQALSAWALRYPRLAARLLERIEEAPDGGVLVYLPRAGERDKPRPRLPADVPMRDVSEWLEINHHHQAPPSKEMPMPHDPMPLKTLSGDEQDIIYALCDKLEDRVRVLTGLFSQETEDLDLDVRLDILLAMSDLAGVMRLVEARLHPFIAAPRRG